MIFDINEKKVITSILFLCMSSFAVFSQNVEFKGKVYDENGVALSWVNIGIRNKNIGITTTENGSFQMSISREFKADSILFSRVGYEELVVPVNDLIRANNKISLKAKTITLNEVVVSLEKQKIITLGTKGFTPLMWMSISTREGTYFEHAKIIKIKKLSRLLNANVRVGGNKRSRDSVTYRFNIYKLKEGLPAERLLEKNIIKTFPRSADMLTFSLIDENIYLDQDCAVSFEYIPKNVKGSQPISFRANVAANDAFVRNASVGSWKPMKNGSSCIFVEVEQ